MSAYYNEIDPFAAQWLRNLIAAGHIAPGEVDERSIVDVDHRDLRGFDQCHFFAGIGVWSHVLRSAGWADDRAVWTGSCPCQPFSAAGANKGFEDDRHLWPVWFELIRLCRPVAVFGEQVASKSALAWLDHVCADLEGEGYAVGAVDTCAAGFGAPHIRQRLYWVADSEGERRGRGSDDSDGRRRERSLADSGEANRMAVAGRAERGQRGAGRDGTGSGWPHGQPARSSDIGIVGNATGLRRDSSPQSELDGETAGREQGCRPDDDCEPSATNGFWRDAEWLPCRDGKARPVEPGSPPLVAGASQRVGRLRAYGNSIVAPQATEFVKAYVEVIP